MTDDLHTLGRWTRDRAVATPDRVAHWEARLAEVRALRQDRRP